MRSGGEGKEEEARKSKTSQPQLFVSPKISMDILGGGYGGGLGGGSKL